MLLCTSLLKHGKGRKEEREKLCSFEGICHNEKDRLLHSMYYFESHFLSLNCDSLCLLWGGGGGGVKTQRLHYFRIRKQVVAERVEFLLEQVAHYLHFVTLSSPHGI